MISYYRPDSPGNRLEYYHSHFVLYFDTIIAGLVALPARFMVAYIQLMTPGCLYYGCIRIIFLL